MENVIRSRARSICGAVAVLFVKLWNRGESAIRGPSSGEIGATPPPYSGGFSGLWREYWRGRLADAVWLKPNG
jgi:hypothetical protein